MKVIYLNLHLNHTFSFYERTKNRKYLTFDCIWRQNNPAGKTGLTLGGFNGMAYFISFQDRNKCSRYFLFLFDAKENGPRKILANIIYELHHDGKRRKNSMFD